MSLYYTALAVTAVLLVFEVWFVCWRNSLGRK